MSINSIRKFQYYIYKMIRYYISNTGLDSNTGTSMNSPWKTMEKVNTVILKPGDQVLFHSGETFVGELIINQSGLEENPIVISSYGQGEKPILSGAVRISEWTLDSSQRYFANCPMSVSQVYINNVLLDLARIPAKGFFVIEQGNKKCLIDNQHLNVDYDLTGATVRIRTVNWQYETAKVASHSNSQITFEDNLIYQNNPRYGYLLDNKLEFLTMPGQWYWDENTHKLLVILNNRANPNDEIVEAVVYNNGITLGEHVSHVKINNLQIEKYEHVGILGLGHSSHISVSDCKINDINVYGICLDINSGNYIIKNNTISEIRGRGISSIESSHNQIVGNTVSRIGLYPGYGFDGVNNGIGIAIIKTEVIYKISQSAFNQIKLKDIPSDILSKIEQLVELPYADEKFVIEAIEIALGHSVAAQYLSYVMPLVNAEAKAQKLESTNNLVAYNVVDQTGYAGIRLDGNNSIAECNVIKNTLLYMNDGGALYCWAQNEEYVYNNILRNNIIINAVGSCEATANDLSYAYGIYIDNKCHHITIENNTVVGTTGGILINDESHHQKITGNTLYDNQMGLVFSEYFMPDTLFGCEAYDNILFAKRRNQRALFVECRIREKFFPSLLNRNLYANPYYPFPILALTFKDDIRSFKEYTLSSWQKHYGQDSDSSIIATENHDAGGQKSEILINETNTPKSFDLPTDLLYTDVWGNVLNQKVVVEPFSSFIILQK